METVSNKPVILYAEDDQDDFDMLKESLLQETDKYTLVQAANGTEIISYLEQPSLTTPSLIVLDLNMPVMDGKQTLLWLKANEAFKNIPLMIFTTSSREDDLRLCKSYDCTFFRKPTLYRDLLHVVQIIIQMSNQ